MVLRKSAKGYLEEWVVLLLVGQQAYSGILPGARVRRGIEVVCIRSCSRNSRCDDVLRRCRS